jgi:ATP/maltotriose-dependent transcriptional regulator MalT
MIRNGVGTVKSHLHTVAGKLEAANRVEAVARGRELGLLV